MLAAMLDVVSQNTKDAQQASTAAHENNCMPIAVLAATVRVRPDVTGTYCLLLRRQTSLLTVTTTPYPTDPARACYLYIPL